MTTSSNSSISPFVPTTQVFPEDESQLLMKHTNVYSTIANALNLREISIYDLQQLQTGQQFFNPANVQRFRYTYRKVFNVGAIAPGATLNVAHGITHLVSLTRMYGTCITATGHVPLPCVDVLNVTNQISLRCGAVNLTIVNGATSPAITSAIVVLEYILG